MVDSILAVVISSAMLLTVFAVVLSALWWIFLFLGLLIDKVKEKFPEDKLNPWSTGLVPKLSATNRRLRREALSKLASPQDEAIPHPEESLLGDLEREGLVFCNELWGGDACMKRWGLTDKGELELQGMEAQLEARDFQQQARHNQGVEA